MFEKYNNYETLPLTPDGEPDFSGIEMPDLDRYPTYLPYSPARIAAVLREEGYDFQQHQGYKLYRYNPKKKYYAKSFATGELLFSWCTLYEVRCWLAKNNVPLVDPRPKYQRERNQRCEAFLEAVSKL